MSYTGIHRAVRYRIPPAIIAKLTQMHDDPDAQAVLAFIHERRCGYVDNLSKTRKEQLVAVLMALVLDPKHHHYYPHHHDVKIA